jgi:hypothetical protein
MVLNPARPPPRVLVVDDDAVTREMLRKGLKCSGVDATGAANATDALRIVADTPPHAVLLDMGLPDTDGYDLCRLLRERPDTHRTPIIGLPPGIRLMSSVRLTRAVTPFWSNRVHRSTCSWNFGGCCRPSFTRRRSIAGAVSSRGSFRPQRRAARDTGGAVLTLFTVEQRSRRWASLGNCVTTGGGPFKACRP